MEHNYGNIQAMMWQSETNDQWLTRCQSGIRCFALFPTKMEDGKVVWLEHYWSVMHRIESGSIHCEIWKSSYRQEDMIFPTSMGRPPSTGSVVNTD
jgi:hypothetical protein